LQLWRGARAQNPGPAGFPAIFAGESLSIKAFLAPVSALKEQTSQSPPAKITVALLREDNLSHCVTRARMPKRSATGTA
jgi:hypothetical protein